MTNICFSLISLRKSVNEFTQHGRMTADLPTIFCPTINTDTDVKMQYSNESKTVKERRKLGIISIIGCIVLFTIIFTLYFNKSFTVYNSSFFSNHFRRFGPVRPSFDIVLSYYREDPTFVARFIQYLRNVTMINNRSYRVIVYNKNSNVSDQQLKQMLNADFIKTLPNVGREGATYLTHIIDNYVHLADHTLFSQAGVEGITDTGLESWFEHRLEKQFNDTVGFMPLVVNNMISVYDCDRHPSGTFPRLPELWAMLEQTLCPLGGQAVSFRGQFLVSRKAIHRRSIRIYEYLNELITAKADHWIHRDPRMSPNTQSTPDNPIFGYVVERLWTILFKCAKPNLADRCRQKQCMCFD